MERMVLLKVENRLLKGLLLKYIASENIGVMEILDRDDLKLKLDVFGPKISLVLLELTESNMDIFKEEVDCLKEAVPQTPLIALVSKDTADVVGFATRLSIKDIMYIPKGRDLYRKVIQDKLQPYFDQWASHNIAPHAILNDLVKQPELLETLTRSFKHAQRGSYPVTLVMASLTGEEAWKSQGFYETARACLRDTDRLLKMDDRNYLGIFPYTQKKDALVLEQKFRKAFETEFGKPGHHISLHLYSSTFPVDDQQPEKLLERLKNGISNSMVVNSMRVPLNTLSKNELESYKQKIKQYRRFM